MINPKDIIRAFEQQIPDDIRTLAQAFIDTPSRRFVLGRTQRSAALLDLFDISGIVDDFCEPGTTWQGKSVFRGRNLPAGAIVINAVLSSPRTLHERLSAQGVAVLSYADFCRCSEGKVPLLYFVEEARNDLEEHLAHWQALYDDFHDDASRQVCRDILRFRLTGDYHGLAAYSNRPWDQYFDSAIGSSIDVFVDAGGYDGDTSEEFCKRYPNYQRVYLFEPSAENLAKAKQRLAKVRDIEYIPQGVSDSCGTLSFSDGQGSSSAVSSTGTIHIPVTTIDAAIAEPVSMIKMDLEGWELHALKGAEQHIRNDCPILAIGAYHHASDFWRIREYVRSLGCSYDLHIRHYTESLFETVLYFVPSKR